jgi:rod shape-determining protein MreC
MLALLASLVLFFVDTRLDYFKPVRSALATVVYPIQVTASVPGGMVDWITEFFQQREALRDEITVLEASSLLQSIRLQKMQALERENMRLRELLGSSFRLQERVQVAELLTVDLDPFSQQVVIDKGNTYGVYVGQPVLDAKGVMGQVTETSPLSSRVVLLTDPSHSIPVQINRNGLRAVVTGRGLGEPLQMEYLPHNADVRVGDLLVTSGLGGRFPLGYPVGEVMQVNFPQGKAFAEITVQPAANLATSREVMLVLPGQKIQVDPVLTTVSPAAEEASVEMPEESADGNND